MSEQDRHDTDTGATRLERLLSLHLDGMLGERETDELVDIVRNNPNAVREAARALCMHAGLIGKLDSEATPRDLTASILERIENPAGAPLPRAGRVARPRRPARVRYGAWLSVAACLAIIAGTVVYNVWQSGRTLDVMVARIRATSPNVKIVHRENTAIARINMPVYAGDRIETGNGQSITFTYEGEKTEILMRADTILDVGGTAQGKRLDLETGILDATVDPQPEGMPMVVETPHARAEVLGTRFTLAAGSVLAGERTVTGTRLDVATGLVRFTRLSDERFVKVGAGHYAVAAAGVDLEATALPASLPEPSTDTAGPTRYGRTLFEDDFTSPFAERWDAVEAPIPATWMRVLAVRPLGKRSSAAVTQRARGSADHQADGTVNAVALTSRPSTVRESPFAGILSRETIPAERFVIEVTGDFQRKPTGRTRVLCGIQAKELVQVPLDTGDRPSAYIHNPFRWDKGTSYADPFVLRAEFRPAGRPRIRGPREPEDPPLDPEGARGVLECRFFLGGRDAQPYHGTVYVRPESTKILIAVLNAKMIVHRVTVREIVEAPDEGGGE